MRKKQAKPQKIKKRNYRNTYSKEALLAAYNEVKATGLPVQTVATKYGVPPQTLRDRVQGRIDPDDCSPGPETLFTKEEELILVEHVEVLAQLGYGYTNVQLQHLAGDMAFDFGRRRKNKPLTNKWLYSFLGRWGSRLASLNPRRLESTRPKGSTPEIVESYYTNLEDVLDKYHLKDKPHFIYNLDETGLQPEHRPPNVIAPPNSKPQSVTSPRSTTVTVIGCVNAIGNSLPPFFVFKGKRFMPGLMKGSTAGSKYVMSDSGWSNAKIFQQYLQTHFLPLSRSNANNDQPIILLYDGHTSHISTPVIEWAREHNIILFVLPPHTSHLLQPLDVGIFGPFKNYYHTECSLYMKHNMGKIITRYEICDLACRAYLKAMSPSNILSTLKKTGISPFSKQSIDADKLYPAVAFRENEPVKKIMAMKTGKEAVEKFLQAKLEKQMPETTEVRSATCEKTQSNKRPAAGGVAITEDVFVTKMKQYENNKSAKETLTDPITITDNIAHSKPKAKKMLTAHFDPKPPTSGTHVTHSNENIILDSDCSFEEEILEEDLCCVCHMASPDRLDDFPYMKSVNWAECEKCGHWTHLTFCTNVTVVRRHSTFLCPHCM